MYFHPIFYTIYIDASDVKSAHTHTLSVSFGDVNSVGLVGEGIRSWEGME